MVGTSADNTHAYPVALVPSSKSINDIDAFPGVEVINSTLTVDAPDLIGGVSHDVLSPRDGLPDQKKQQPSRMHEMRGSRAATCKDACSDLLIGYAPSVHDVGRRISKANFLSIDGATVEEQRQVRGTYVGFHRLVHRAPPDIILGRVFFYNALIRGRAAGFRTRVC